MRSEQPRPAASLCLTALALACLGPAVLTAPAVADPPETRVNVVTDDYHGTTVEDPYRWLEGGTEELDYEVAEWTAAQNGYTRGFLDALPGRDELADDLRELLEVGSITAPRSFENRYFYQQREGDENQPILFWREGAGGRPRVLINPNELHEEGLISLDWYAPNQDGSLVAFGISEAGDEMSVLHIIETESGEWLSDEIPNRAGSVDWFPDGRSFIYDALRDPENPYSSEIRYHEVGENPEEDVILWKQFSETWGPWVQISDDGRWMIASYWTGTNSNDVWVVDASRWKRTGDFDRVTITTGKKDAMFMGFVYGDTFYMQETSPDHPNGVVYGVNLNDPAKENWDVVIPEREGAVLQSISPARGMLVATYMQDVATTIERFKLDGEPIGPVTLPGIGSAGIVTNPDRTEAFFAYESFNQPQTIYQVDLKTDKRSEWASLDVPVDPEIAEVKRVWYESKDGTQVSMFLVHRKGLKLNGDNPVLLYGYGGFNNPVTPFFWSTKFPFFEEGGVVALPHLRGGGEYGAAWHRGGMLESKQKTFDDFIAAAEWLIDNKYTQPSRLAIYGGSNGGLTVGAFLTQRPDLCGAAICSVPLLDMLRFQNFLMARYWVPEYGTAEDPEQFRFIAEYSPYQNIEEDVAYPATLYIAGEHDSRVHPLHARKMAAYMQRVTTADQTDEPILLWVDQSGGHGQGKPFSLRLRDAVDFHAFLYWQLGLTEN